MSINFAHLRPYDEQLFRLGSLAERYFPDDPNTALIKLRGSWENDWPSRWRPGLERSPAPRNRNWP